MGLTIKQMINRTGQKWFLEEDISCCDIGEDHMGEEYIDLSLTDYKLERVFEKEVYIKLSKLRYITIKDCLIKPGFGKGTLTINDRNFKVTYAWGGLNSKKHFHRLLNYTVRIKPLDKFNLYKFVNNFTKIIYFDENIRDFRKRVKKVLTFTFKESTYLKRKYMKE